MDDFFSLSDAGALEATLTTATTAITNVSEVMKASSGGLYTTGTKRDKISAKVIRRLLII